MSPLDPRWWARLAPLEIRARALADSAVAGRHRGRRAGLTGEFFGHRPYALGDERRLIDWKVFARTDRWVVREARVESALRMTLVLDVSRSMAYSENSRPSKLQAAVLLLAAVATLLTERQESCGLALINDRLVDRLPVRGGADSLHRLCTVLENAVAEGPTDVAQGLTALRPHLPRRGMLLFASDFLQPPEKWVGPLRDLSARGHEIIAFQILDPAEERLEDHGNVEYVDMETGARWRGETSAVADRYADFALRRQALCARALSSAGIDHVLFHTNAALDEILARYLRQRRGRE